MDEIWGYVTAVLDEGEILVELTEIAESNDGDYEEIERVQAAGTFEVGDFVHVEVERRGSTGTLIGAISFAQEQEEDDEAVETPDAAAGGPR